MVYLVVVNFSFAQVVYPRKGDDVVVGQCILGGMVVIHRRRRVKLCKIILPPSHFI